MDLYSTTEYISDQKNGVFEYFFSFHRHELGECLTELSSRPTCPGNREKTYQICWDFEGRLLKACAYISQQLEENVVVHHPPMTLIWHLTKRRREAPQNPFPNLM